MENRKKMFHEINNLIDIQKNINIRSEYEITYYE